MDTMTRDLTSSTDASVWAKHFTKTFHEVLERYGLGKEAYQIDNATELEGWMIGWFANAIEVAREAGAKAARKEMVELIDQRDPSVFCRVIDNA